MISESVLTSLSPVPAPASAPEAAAESAAALVVRPATLADVDALVALENRCFDSDRLSRRSFHHLLTRGHAALSLAERDGRLLGYALVLFHGQTALARLYSLAVAQEARGQGVARRLLTVAEADALAEGCAVLRLEVRADNAPAIALYRDAGYRRFAVVPDYYEDHEPAERMEKILTRGAGKARDVPYVPQSLDFTCGPASLMMAMAALDPESPRDRSSELRLWRESTLVFMTSGHGGCGAYGLSLAAWKRGFDLRVFITDKGPPFLDSVRSEDKKEVMRLVHQDFVAEALLAGIPVEERGLSANELADFVEAGAVPVVLISSYRIYGEKYPHWVTVTGADHRFLYIHDPFVDVDQGKTATDCIHVPIARAEFDRMARYGSARLRAAVVLTGRRRTAGEAA
ncbi:Ribosomal protein S18 acetylase RimI [Tistlia consotensis]|uniref:Ribosomal protein S18 acetylase RimI n=1 Tax=Tistlia consotensis USBA 355 TaxID=560819 RepID=A0A1Y6B518_9PROT|nr:GNAT family N-acetyltransferase/peptidase C39 family protein [Tistlia consotensis]SME88174.1 Ribosomal protein S18 acetylase RimI [Tistlia consotensis USBA 355]SNR24596.1 Ribosomal protein S18 acetylase RimI [Tistlia consotensis]